MIRDLHPKEGVSVTVPVLFSLLSINSGSAANILVHSNKQMTCPMLGFHGKHPYLESESAYLAKTYTLEHGIAFTSKELM